RRLGGAPNRTPGATSRGTADCAGDDKLGRRRRSGRSGGTATVVLRSARPIGNTAPHSPEWDEYVFGRHARGERRFDAAALGQPSAVTGPCLVCLDARGELQARLPRSDPVCVWPMGERGYSAPF